MNPSKRFKALAIVLGAVVLAGVLGWVIGRYIQSPADRAASRRAPTPSKITVPVEERTLESTVITRGTVHYGQAATVSLGGEVGGATADGMRVNKVPAVGDSLDEGTVVFEINGRPVFALTGSQAMYRTLGPGSKGPDVRQLEEALNRLGFSPGTVDDVYDTGTKQAVDSFYRAKGYDAQGPNDEQQTELTNAQREVDDANAAVTAAQQALSDASVGPTQSQLLQLQSDVRKAQDEITTTQKENAKNLADAQNEVAAKALARDQATVTRNRAQATLTAAQQPGAINPDTGNPYTPAEIAALGEDLTVAQSALTAAQKDLDAANAALAAVTASNAKNLADAQDALKVAQAALSEAQRPPSTAAQVAALNDARNALSLKQLALATLQAKVGTNVPAGEVLFFPSLPVRVETVKVKAGEAPVNDLLSVSSSELQVDASVRADQRQQLRVGLTATVEAVDLGVTFSATISKVADQPGTDGVDAARFAVVATPDDEDAALKVVNQPVRLTVPINSTSGKVLVVPIAALSTSADGSSRVEKLIGDSDESEQITVKVGLAAQGYVQIEPTAGKTLVAGDRVVVGQDLFSDTPDTAATTSTTPDSTADSTGGSTADSTGGSAPTGTEDGTGTVATEPPPETIGVGDTITAPSDSALDDTTTKTGT